MTIRDNLKFRSERFDDSRNDVNGYSRRSAGTSFRGGHLSRGSNFGMRQPYSRPENVLKPWHNQRNFSQRQHANRNKPQVSSLYRASNQRLLERTNNFQVKSDRHSLPGFRQSNGVRHGMNPGGYMEEGEFRPRAAPQGVQKWTCRCHQKLARRKRPKKKKQDRPETPLQVPGAPRNTSSYIMRVNRGCEAESPFITGGESPPRPWEGMEEFRKLLSPLGENMSPLYRPAEVPYRPYDGCSYQPDGEDKSYPGPPGPELESKKEHSEKVDELTQKFMMLSSKEKLNGEARYSEDRFWQMKAEEQEQDIFRLLEDIAALQNKLYLTEQELRVCRHRAEKLSEEDLEGVSSGGEDGWAAESQVGNTYREVVVNNEYDEAETNFKEAENEHEEDVGHVYVEQGENDEEMENDEEAAGNYSNNETRA